jgi:hypothetical protein
MAVMPDGRNRASIFSVIPNIFNWESIRGIFPINLRCLPADPYGFRLSERTIPRLSEILRFLRMTEERDGPSLTFSRDDGIETQGWRAVGRKIPRWNKRHKRNVRE